MYNSCLPFIFVSVKMGKHNPKRLKKYFKHHRLFKLNWWSSAPWSVVLGSVSYQIHTHTHTHGCVCVRRYAWACLYLYNRRVYMYVCLYLYNRHVCVRLYLHNRRVCVCVYIYITDMSMCVYGSVFVFMRTYAYKMHICIFYIHNLHKLVLPRIPKYVCAVPTNFRMCVCILSLQILVLI